MNLTDTVFSLVWADDESYIPNGRVANTKYTATITAAGGETSFTAPTSSEKWAVVIELETSKFMFMAVNGTASLPAGATFALSDAEMISSRTYTIRQVNSGDTLSFITPEVSLEVSLSFYALEK